MLKRVLVLSSASVAVLLVMSGCGSTAAKPVPPLSPVSDVIPIDGRWVFTTDIPAPITVGTLPGVPIFNFSGVLHTNGTAVNGVGRFSAVTVPDHDVVCLLPTALAVHGTFSSTRHLSLTSDPVQGGILTVELDIPSDPHKGVTGKASVSGTCAIPSAPAIGILFDPVNGTYTGSLQQYDLVNKIYFGPAATTTVTATETDPDASGASVVSGKAQLTFPGCTTSVPFTAERFGGGILIPTHPALMASDPLLPVVFATPAPNASKLGLAVRINDVCTTAKLPGLSPSQIGSLSRQ